MPTNHFADPIADTPGRIGGTSRLAGGASIDVKVTVVNRIVEYGRLYNLSDKDIANLVAIAKIESGFNPDAAARGAHTSASGIFQITDSTASDAIARLNGKPRANNIEPGNYDRFDIDSNIKYGIVIYLDKKARAKSEDAYDIYKSWNSNPDEYQKFEVQLKKDSADYEKNLKEGTPILVSLQLQEHEIFTAEIDSVYVYKNNGLVLEITDGLVDIVGNNTTKISETITTIDASTNSTQITTKTDANADGKADIITVGVDTNHDGIISAGETVSTGNRNQASLLDADSQIDDWHDAGLINNATYIDYTAWSTAQLLDTGNSGGAGGSGQPPIYTLPPQDNPIGAFYESVSPVNDNALSISKKTPVILDAGNANAKLTAAQLAARDTNADGRLTAGELARLTFYLARQSQAML